MPNTTSYGRLLAEAPVAGRCPVWISDCGRRSVRTERFPAATLDELDGRDAATVLAKRWPGRCYPWCDCRAPFGEECPGMAPASDPHGDPIAAAVELADSPARRHLALVPVSRPADVPAALCWNGMCNAVDEVVGLSAVLRSWEDRFGALLVSVALATSWVSVAAPPWTEEGCLRTLAGARHRRFWWD